MKSEVLSFLQKEIDDGLIPGAVIQISYQNEVILREAIGNRVVYPNKAPMSLDTVFDLASLTKVVATLPAFLKLLDDGRIRLDDKVSDFLQEFACENKDEIRIRHLLTHTSGLPSHREFFKESLNTEQVLNRIYQEKPVAPLGTKVIYSDLGIILLYKIIETITGEKFEVFVQKNIFNPLDMNETCFRPKYPNDRYAVTEFSETLGGYKTGIVHDENTESMGGISGHAGLFSTVSDLSKYTSMIENDGVYNGKRIISKSAIQISRKNYTSFDQEYRGLGWILKSQTLASCGDLFSDSSYGHTGFTGTSIWFDPEVKLHVILLTNRVHFGRNDAILRLRPRLHNLVRARL